MTMRSEAEQLIKDWLMNDCEYAHINEKMLHIISQANLDDLLDALQTLASSRLECFRNNGAVLVGDTDRAQAAQMLRSFAAAMNYKMMPIAHAVVESTADLSALLLMANGGGDVDPKLARLLAQQGALRLAISRAVELAERFEANKIDAPAPAGA